MEGKITKGIAGFYYVHYGEHLYECKAKGIFRKNKEKPLVGDNVLFDILSEESKEGNIRSILPRKNSLIRPEVANIDQIFVVCSISFPEPNYYMLNRYLVQLMMQAESVPLHFIVNKNDLGSDSMREDFSDAYKNTGIFIHFISVKTGQGIDELRSLLFGKTTVLAGPSGVGKSSLINAILNHDAMKTGELSAKIERGRHTTRHSEIFTLDENTYLFDTPGFTSVALDGIEKEELSYFFPEFSHFLGNCRFSSCVHMEEPDCGVKNGVAEGHISKIRYESYRTMYQELKERRRY